VFKPFFIFYIVFYSSASSSNMSIGVIELRMAHGFSFSSFAFIFCGISLVDTDSINWVFNISHRPS